MGHRDSPVCPAPHKHINQAIKIQIYYLLNSQNDISFLKYRCCMVFIMVKHRNINVTFYIIFYEYEFNYIHNDMGDFMIII